MNKAGAEDDLLDESDAAEPSAEELNDLHFLRRSRRLRSQSS